MTHGYPRRQGTTTRSVTVGGIIVIVLLTAGFDMITGPSGITGAFIGIGVSEFSVTKVPWFLAAEVTDGMGWAFLTNVGRTARLGPTMQFASTLFATAITIVAIGVGMVILLLPKHRNGP